MRKGQSLSINTIIIAALGLAVLVILGMMFFGKTQAFSQGLDKCSSKFGNCAPAGSCIGQTIVNTDCEKENKGVCCVTLNSPAQPT